jgi:hypothetical protein
MKKIKCECACHTTPQMVHFQACCDNGWVTVYEHMPMTEELAGIIETMEAIDQASNEDRVSPHTNQNVFKYAREHKKTLIEYYKNQYEYWERGTRL